MDCTPFAVDSYIPGLVSVIVPVYNREKIVGKTLGSIVAQSYPSVETIVVNDGSTDGTQSVLEAYKERYPGKVVAIDQANAGQVRARNRGIAESRGEFIAFLDSDDTWDEEKLSLQMPLFRGNVGLVYCGIHEVDTNGGIVATVLPEPGLRGDIYRHLLVRNRMTGGSVVVTRKALEEVGLFDESFRAAENWDLWIRISRRFAVDFVDKPLVSYLKHPGNMSRDGERMSHASWSILQKHLPSAPSDPNLKKTYLQAYANYYYQRGVQSFGEYNFAEARRMFIKSWKYRPLYRDSSGRVIRTLLGKQTNLLLAKMKKCSTGLFQII